MSYYTDFIQVIIDASEANNWDTAVEEWRVVGYVDDPSGTESCLCGQDNLRYVFSIENKLNGSYFPNIGSTCVKKFHSEDMDDDVKSWLQVNRLIEEASKRGDLLKVPFGAPYYSKNLIWFFYQNDVFKESSYNNFDPHNDYEFMIDMFNARHQPTKGQVNKLRILIKNYIRPFLADVWIRSRKVN